MVLMVLKMTQPFKHPITGIYQFRKRVPKDLIPLIGKSEEKVSLGTREPREAKVLHASITAAVEARWAQYRQGRISLSFKQAVAMAGEIYRDYITTNEHAPFCSDATLAVFARNYLNPHDTRLSRIDQNTLLGKIINDKWRKKVLQPPE